MPKIKDKKFAFRVNSGDMNKIRAKAKKAKLTVTDYLVSSALGKDIVVIDGLDDLLGEMKAAGRNLNQLTTKVNMGIITAVNLDKLIDLYGEIFRKLRSLTEKEAA